ncbi:putative toxin-antitoxin system toxin component, PIN family [Dactylococcopsis salina PCC 8305]|uniref:Toxin-antitoxin system toxin component, PIN family n=1 Tax=Dactylococcopsis salina (strain PCC 8305) TaxID=13035 RepID=K9YXS1_DACS8|nr:putative toxin-antitoxin system toxin component, PIN family [Dactylococcopsis salina PCC 8305]
MLLTKRLEKTVPKIVLDTNILISSLISKKSFPYLLYQGWRRKEFTLITSEEQLQELKQVLQYPKLRKFINQDEARILVSALQDFTVTVADLPEVNYSKDSDDNLIIATAIAGKADLIVTGDKGDLLILKTVENISIVTASDAVSIIGIEKTDTNLS